MLHQPYKMLKKSLHVNWKWTHAVLYHYVEKTWHKKIPKRNSFINQLLLIVFSVKVDRKILK